MDLAPLHFMFEQQLQRSERAFKHAIGLTAKTDSVRRRHLLEGVLSDTWQAYCAFVRNVCIKSATGCRTASGATYPPSVAPSSWERVSYVAIRSAKGKSIAPGVLNGVLRKEPTWGDSSNIVEIINGISPGNAGTLIGAFAGGMKGPKHCQTVRNACAHKNIQTRLEVEALAPHYSAMPLSSPTDAMLWYDGSSSMAAFLSWVEDMRVIAESAVQ